METTVTGIAGFFESIGTGLQSLMPSVADSTVTTVDTLVYTAEGALTTVAQLGVVGIVCGAAFVIFKLVTRKAKKHF